MLNEKTDGFPSICTGFSKPNSILSNTTLPDLIATGIQICTTCSLPVAQCVCNVTATSTTWKFDVCEFPRQGCTCGQHKEKEKNQKKEKSCYITYASFGHPNNVDQLGPVFMNEDAAGHYCSEQNDYREWRYTKVELYE